MKAMKGCLLSSVALSVFIAAPAMAADLPVKAPPAAPPPAVAALPNWSGFYAGVNAGADWAYSGDPSTSVSCGPASGYSFGYFDPFTPGCPDIPAVNALGTGSMSGSGFTGGAQAGYNWQFNSTVVGAEVDFDAFHAKASRTGSGTVASVFPVSGTITNSVDANWLFTARGRLGWAFNDVLAYATGGLAVTHLTATNSYADPTPTAVTWSNSATKAGWTAGAGLEWALSQHWSARVEYLYVHFDAITASGVVADNPPPGYGSAISTSTDLSAHIVRAAINYKF